MGAFSLFFFFSVFGFCLYWICVADCLHLFFAEAHHNVVCTHVYIHT